MESVNKWIYIDWEYMFRILLQMGYVTKEDQRHYFRRLVVKAGWGLPFAEVQNKEET
jgi:hypothetical protein